MACEVQMSGLSGLKGRGFLAGGWVRACRGSLRRAVGETCRGCMTGPMLRSSQVSSIPPCSTWSSNLCPVPSPSAPGEMQCPPQKRLPVPLSSPRVVFCPLPFISAYTHMVQSFTLRSTVRKPPSPFTQAHANLLPKGLVVFPICLCF